MMKRLQAAMAVALSLQVFVPNVASATGYAPDAGVTTTDSFESWQDKVAGRRADVHAFEAFLVRQGVAGVLPTREILLNDTSWSECHMDGPYSLAQRAYWPHIVGTLRYIRDEIVPAIGPVQVESGYRDPGLNRCSGGASHSAHAQFYALDLAPTGNITRSVLIARICANHARTSAAYHIGLGFYDALRFHIDSRSFRRWGSDYHASTSPCARAIA